MNCYGQSKSLAEAFGVTLSTVRRMESGEIGAVPSLHLIIYSHCP